MYKTRQHDKYIPKAVANVNITIYADAEHHAECGHVRPPCDYAEHPRNLCPRVNCPYIVKDNLQIQLRYRQESGCSNPASECCLHALYYAVALPSFLVYICER
jgi:hypothetical protein